MRKKTTLAWTGLPRYATMSHARLVACYQPPGHHQGINMAMCPVCHHYHVNDGGTITALPVLTTHKMSCRMINIPSLLVVKWVRR